MNSTGVDRLRKVIAQLEALHDEVVSAAKKSPDKAISAFKVKLANAVLDEARVVLGASTPRLGFDNFDTDDLPTYSDVSMIVSQFVECSEKLRCENIRRMSTGAWYWVIDRETSNVATKPPKGGR